MALQRTLITHWLPIVTFCPVNKLPDLIYITITVEDQFLELYQARKRIRKVAAWRLRFMEDIAGLVHIEFPEAQEVKVSLLFNRHVVTLRKPS